MDHCGHKVLGDAYRPKEEEEEEEENNRIVILYVAQLTKQFLQRNYTKIGIIRDHKCRVVVSSLCCEKGISVYAAECMMYRCCMYNERSQLHDFQICKKCL